MSNILLVDDDRDQLEIRKLLFEHSGHSVSTAQDADSALANFARAEPDIVVLDLHLAEAEDAYTLIRDFRKRKPAVRIVVLSGWTHDLAGREEAQMVDSVVPKPTKSGRLLSLIANLSLMLLLLSPLQAQPRNYPFSVDRAGEATATLTMSAVNANWAREGHEAAMADISLDDNPPFQVMLYAGDTPQPYPVFLGALKAGPHRLAVTQNRQFSSPGTSISIAKVDFETGQDSQVLAHAPVLFARQNTIGKFTDVPIIVYAEEIREGPEPELVYTVIFTNEDGGTSTRALMARWGRTTDVEYVYKVNPRTHRAIIQGRDHKDFEFKGKRDGDHPLLIPITDNNMIGDEAPSPIRYQIPPVLVDLSAHSREQVMDDQPFSYRIMAEELTREGKLRPFGLVDGEKVSDPRNYLYIEAKVANKNSGVSFNIRLKDEHIWRSGNIGRTDYAISRDGWIRTTVELPPGTQARQIAEIGLDCLVYPVSGRGFPLSGECEVEAISKAFLLDQQYRPGPSIFHMSKPVRIPSGQMQTFSNGR